MTTPGLGRNTRGRTRVQRTTKAQGQAAGLGWHSGSKRRAGEGPRAGYDDARYRESCARLKLIGNNICAWCHHPIDLQLKSPHPLSWSADHKTPRSQLAPHDPRHWHIDHLQEMHRRCNESRGARPMPLDRPLDTSIEW